MLQLSIGCEQKTIKLYNMLTFAWCCNIKPDVVICDEIAQHVLRSRYLLIWDNKFLLKPRCWFYKYCILRFFWQYLKSRPLKVWEIGYREVPINILFRWASHWIRNIMYNFIWKCIYVLTCSLIKFMKQEVCFSVLKRFYLVEGCC